MREGAMGDTQREGGEEGEAGGFAEGWAGKGRWGDCCRRRRREAGVPVVCVGCHCWVESGGWQMRVCVDGNGWRAMVAGRVARSGGWDEPRLKIGGWWKRDCLAWWGWPGTLSRH